LLEFIENIEQAAKAEKLTQTIFLISKNIDLWRWL
jgi:hypothetical protein